MRKHSFAVVAWFLIALCGCTTARLREPMTCSPRQALDEIAGEVATSLQHPIVRRFTRDRAADHFEACLSLASVWPAPRFKAPLREMLMSDNDAHVLRAASGLLNYDDVECVRAVVRLADDPRRSGPEGLHSVGQQIRRELKQWATAPRPLDPEASAVPVDEWGDLDLAALQLRTLPEAVESLHSEHASLRMRAFLWLATYGIVIDATPFVETWPRLSATQRTAVLERLSCAKVCWGRQLLRNALEASVASSDWQAADERLKIALLNTLGELHSPAVHSLAMEIVRTQLPLLSANSSPGGDEMPDDLASSAFRALAQTATPDDLAQAFLWIHSAVAGIRRGGACVLTASETDEAANAVLEYLRNEEASLAEPLDDPLGCLAQHRWRDESIKRKYMRELIEIAYARACTAPDADERTRTAQLLRAVDLLETVEALAQESLGATGQSGAPIPMVVNAHTLCETLTLWRAHLR